ncbi:MAG: RICIN domain-containing protein [Saprospiraceae bacterium]|nr:RICIN domain-containing protein [Saprospiraceae bacterium]
MKKNLVIQLLCTAFCCFVSCFHIEAQFDSGATSLTEARLVDRAWHLSSKEDGNPLVRASGTSLYANNNTINAASTFVIDDGPNDNKWWTTDVRWFHIKSQSTGQYLTVPGNVPGIALTLAPLIEGNVISSQQFRLVATLQEGWYKLRSRMGDLVIEVNSSGQLIVDSPELDPSANQKFAFNLAMPGSARYAIYSAGNNHFFSDNGVLAEGAPAVHIKNSNASIVWQFQAAGGGYYRIYNTLTKQYLALPPGGGAGSELIMTTSTGTNSHWELKRNNTTFYCAQIQYKLDHQYEQPTRQR